MTSRAAVALIATVVLWLGPAAGLSTGQPTGVRAAVTDQAGVLSASGRAAIERTIAEARRRGIDLHVLFVDDTAGRQVSSYAREVAAASSMGGDDALLVVAFGDRTHALWSGDGLRVSDSESEAILDRLVAPPLRAGNIPAAVDAALAGLVRAQTGRGVTSADRSRGGFPWLLLILLGMGLLVVLRMRRARRGDREAVAEPAPQVDVEALAGEANAALVRVDDQLRDAEHEAGFAEAQYGSDEGAALRTGLERARTELQQAFALRQQLDDRDPEPPHEQVAMLESIMARTSAAEAIIEERLRQIEELRGIERDPTVAVTELRARMNRVAQRIPAVEATMAELRAAAPSVVSAVDGNVAEAQKRLAFAGERVREAESTDTAAAAQALRAGGAALAQAEQLLDAIEDLAGRARTARESLPQELQEAEIAVARAEDLVRSRRHIVGREARTRLVEAQRRYDRARSLAEQDPAAAGAEADAAEQLADEAFELAWQDSEDGGDGGSGYGGSFGGGFGGFGWGLPIPIPIPFPTGGGIGWGGTSWGGGGGLAGGGFGDGGLGGGRW